MLNKDQIMPLLLEVSPSFRVVWDMELDEEDRKLVYLCLGFFAEHLMALEQQGRTAEFGAVAEVIERLHVEGDAATKEAATIGLLEGIQNVWGNNGVATGTLEELLGPQSRLWWQQLELFWSGAIPYVGATMPNKAMEPTR